MRRVLCLATVTVVLIGLAAHAAAGGSKAVLKAPLVDRLTGDEVGWCMFQTTRDGAPQAKIRVVDGVPDTELAVELLVALEQGGGAQIVAANTAYVNAQASGSNTAVSIVSGAVGADGSVFQSHDQSAAGGAGTYHCHYLWDFNS